MREALMREALMAFPNAFAAELAKLLTLPAIRLAALAAVIAGACIAGALASGGQGQGMRFAAGQAVLFAVPFVQACFVLLGVLPMTHERDGGQLRTSLSAVPSRARFVLAKTSAVAALLAVTATLAVALSLGAAWVATRVGEGVPQASSVNAAALAGAAAYLALIGLFAHATALLLRRFVPALVSVLGLVLLLPPLLGGTEHARWLPSRAGELLYTGGDPVLTAATGALVLGGWIVAVGVAGLAALRLRDA